jgi:hypothetical protein
MSALATIIGSLGELSESELRQLYLVVGVRLGYPGVPTGPKGQGKGGGESADAKKKPAKGGGSSDTSKGNPQRKSQWANHPLYQEYARLKKTVETQSKELKCSFNAVDTAESRAYQQAFNRWLEAKASFRGHGESGQLRGLTTEGEDEDSEEESEEKKDPSKAGSSTQQGRPAQQSKTASPQGAAPGVAGKSGTTPTKSAASAGKGKAPTK